MTIAYRCDTGTLIVSPSSGTASTISFPGTQPVAGDLVVFGGASNGAREGLNNVQMRLRSAIEPR